MASSGRGSKWSAAGVAALLLVALGYFGEGAAANFRLLVRETQAAHQPLSRPFFIINSIIAGSAHGSRTILP